MISRPEALGRQSRAFANLSGSGHIFFEVEKIRADILTYSQHFSKNLESSNLVCYAMIWSNALGTLCMLIVFIRQSKFPKLKQSILRVSS